MVWGLTPDLGTFAVMSGLTATGNLFESSKHHTVRKLFSLLTNQAQGSH